MPKFASIRLRASLLGDLVPAGAVQEGRHLLARHALVRAVQARLAAIRDAGCRQAVDVRLMELPASSLK
jgi:hypothetical protein